MRAALSFFGLVALFLGWNAPNHYPPWTTFHLEVFTAIGVLLLGLAQCVKALPRALDGAPPAASSHLPIPRAARYWLLVGLLPLAQFGLGRLNFRGDALVGFMYGAGAALAICVGQLWAVRRGRSEVIHALCITLVLSGLASAGVALGQWLRLSTPGWWAMQLIDDRPYGNLAQPNHFGLLMVMCVIAVTVLFETAAIQRRWVLGLALAFFGWGVLISGSRASSLALLALAGCWMLSRQRAPTRLRATDVWVALAAGALLSLAVEPLQHLLTVGGTQVRQVAEVGPRQWIWLHFWAAISERPWFGYGFNQGVLALAEVAAQVHPSRNVTFAHNLVLDLMTWFGVPLALVLCAGFAAWVAGWLARPRDLDPHWAAQRHWVFAFWLVLLIQSMFEFPYAHTYFLLPACLFAGAVTPLPSPAPMAGWRTTPGLATLSVAMVLVALLGVTTYEYARIEDDFRFVRFEKANFANPPAHDLLAEPWVLDQLAALNASARIEIVAGMSAEHLNQLKRLARRFHILSTRIDYAKALWLSGQRREAESEMLIVRSACDPAKYARIERQWRDWLASLPSALTPKL